MKRFGHCTALLICGMLFVAAHPHTLHAARHALDLRVPRGGATLASVAPPKATGVRRTARLAAGAARLGRSLERGDELKLALFDDAETTLRLTHRIDNVGQGIGRSFVAEIVGHEGVQNAAVLETADGLQVHVNDDGRERRFTVFSSPDGVTVREDAPMAGQDFRCGNCMAELTNDLASVGARLASVPPASPSDENEDDGGELGDEVSTANGWVCSWGDLADGEQTFLCLTNHPVRHVDLLMVFDANVEDLGVSHEIFAGMRTMIFNVCLANTRLLEHFQFRLVGVLDITTHYTDPEECLKKVKSPAGSIPAQVEGGEWKRIRDMRETVKADIVSILIGKDTSDVAGIAWGLGEIIPHSDWIAQKDPSTFSAWSYNVSYIVSGWMTQLHEIGHNMGAGHSTKQNYQHGPQSYDFSAGYYFKVDGERYCTIMSYTNPEYPKSGGENWQRIPYFSSKKTYFKGKLVGDGDHNNTRVLEKTCDAVSKFRDISKAEHPIVDKHQLAFALKAEADGSDDPFDFDVDNFNLILHRPTTLELFAPADTGENHIYYLFRPDTEEYTWNWGPELSYEGPVTLTRSGLLLAYIEHVERDSRTGEVLNHVEGENLELKIQRVPFAESLQPRGEDVVSFRASVSGTDFWPFMSLRLENPWNGVYPDDCIRYTTDGSDPRQDSPRYEGPITLTNSATVKAALEYDGRILRTFSRRYERHLDADVSGVRVSPADGTRFIRDLPVEMEPETPGLDIVFTRDGSVPTKNSERYRGPFTISQSTTLNARVLDGDEVGPVVKTVRYVRDASPNDDFANAQAIEVGMVFRVYPGNATREPGEPLAVYLDSSQAHVTDRTVWYRFKAPQNGRVRFHSTCVEDFPGDLPVICHSSLQVYVGGAGGLVGITPAPDVGDICHDRHESWIDLPVEADAEYWLRVAAPDFDSITVDLTCSYLQPNDAYADAAALPADLSSLQGSTNLFWLSHATLEEGEPYVSDERLAGVTASVWFKWTCPVTAFYTFTATPESTWKEDVTASPGVYDRSVACATDVLTLSAFTGPDARNASRVQSVVSTMDAGTLAPPSITFSAKRGTTYRIRVGGDEHGVFRLGWEVARPANDDFVRAFDVTEEARSVAFRATAESGEPALSVVQTASGRPHGPAPHGPAPQGSSSQPPKCVWWRGQTSASPLRITATAEHHAEDALATALAIYRGGSPETLERLGEGEGTASAVVGPNTRYWIQVAGQLDSKSALELSVASEAANATRDGALALTNVPPSSTGAPNPPRTADFTVDDGGERWWTWTSQTTGPARAQVDSFNTQMTVYGNGVAPAKAYGAVAFGAESGTVYTVRLQAGENLSRGTVTVGAAPANANRAAAEEVERLDGHDIHTLGHTFAAPACRVWYAWRAKRSGRAAFTAEFARGTVARLAVYEGSSVTAMATGQNRVSFDAENGTVYFISVAQDDPFLVDRFSFDGALVALNDDLCDAEPISGASGTAAFDLRGATYEEGEPYASPKDGSVWFVWTAPTAGTFEFAHTHAVADYFRCTGTATMPHLAFAAGASEDGKWRHPVTVSAGENIYIQVKPRYVGWVYDTGDFSWQETAPNSSLGDASAVMSETGAVSHLMTLAELDQGERILAANASRSLWYRILPPADGGVCDLRATADFPVTVSVYTSTFPSPDYDDLELLAEASDRVQVAARGGDALYVAVRGWTLDGVEPEGLATLMWNWTPRPPNDDLADAIVLEGLSGGVCGTLQCATLEPGEQQHFGTGSNTTWWTWTAVATNMTFDIRVRAASGFPAPYEYEIRRLNWRTGNADPHAYGSLADRALRVRTTPGDTYYLGLSGFEPFEGSPQAGEVTLEWAASGPPNDTAEAAISLEGAGGASSAHNVGATPEADDPDLDKFPSPVAIADPTNTIWWTWTAPAYGSWEFSATCRPLHGMTSSAPVAISVRDDSSEEIGTYAVETVAEELVKTNDAKVVVEALMGERYWICVSTKFAWDVGQIDLAWRQIAERPAPRTRTSPFGSVSVPYDWLVRHYPELRGASAATLEAKAMEPSGKLDANGARRPVWHDYLLGTDPTDPTDEFRTLIGIEGGRIFICPSHWLDGRTYHIDAKRTLMDREWTEIQGTAQDLEEYRFFRYRVSMP